MKLITKAPGEALGPVNECLVTFSFYYLSIAKKEGNYKQFTLKAGGNHDR
jgi:hypothetical protein